MQDLENGRKRKKRSVLSKLAGGSNQSSPRGLAGSLDSVGNDRTYQSDEYGLEGSLGSDKLEIDSVSKNQSLLDGAETGLGELIDDDTDDDARKYQDFAAAEKNGLDSLDDVDSDDDDDAAVRPGVTDRFRKHDSSSSVEYYSPRQFPAVHQRPVNGGRDISDIEDNEETSEYEEAGAVEAAASDDQNSLLSNRHITQLANPLKDNPPAAELASSSTFASSMMKFFGFNTRGHAPLESSVAASSVSSLSGTVAKMSTKDARNRSVSSYCYQQCLI